VTRIGSKPVASVKTLPSVRPSASLITSHRALNDALAERVRPDDRVSAGRICPGPTVSNRTTVPTEGLFNDAPAAPMQHGVRKQKARLHCRRECAGRSARLPKDGSSC
jgi:hypothetical protein